MSNTQEKQQTEVASDEEENNYQVQAQQPAQNQQVQDSSQGGYRTGYMGGRTPIRESRIKDRPIKKGADEQAVKIKIELDLEVEVDLYARVKGDVMIGLM